MTWGFPFGSKILCKLLCVSWEVFVLHGYDWIHWVAKSCTTIAHRWLFRDSQPSLTTLWSAVIKSPTFSARGTAPPIRLLHGALVILVLWQISQFWSLGKWVLTLFLPKSTLLVGSKDNAWKELACESLCWGTLSSTRFSLNSCNHSGMSEWHGSPRTYSWSSFLFGFLILVGLVNDSSEVSIPIYPIQVFPCPSLTVAWHSCGWWGRRAWGTRGMINFLTWRSRGCWRGKAWGRTRWQTRNHDRNEVLCVALYPKTVFNEMCFFTVDPLVRVSLFIAKLSER